MRWRNSRLVREADKRGIEPARLVFAPLLHFSDHLGRLQLADLALDTYPVNSHTTGSDALWVGVPMVTVLRDGFSGRVGASQLKAADLPEFVATDEAEYVRIAANYATDSNLQNSTREKLVRARLGCSLFDTKGFTRSLERLFLAMVSNRRAGLPEQDMFPGGASFH